jgi:hypothetical protein
MVLVFSEKNRLYALDAINGTLLAYRDLGVEGEPPFQASDLSKPGGVQCNDITDTVGITGTPVIDPSTDTVYFWAKSYNSQGPGSWQNGAYYFHAVDVSTLLEKPGFPTTVEGMPASNDNTRVFTGGTVLQRPSLNIVNGAIIGGFGGHCEDMNRQVSSNGLLTFLGDMFNYTGWVVSMGKDGSYISGISTSAGFGAPLEDGTWNGGGILF